MTGTDRNYLSVTSAARLAGLTTKGIYALIRRKKIPFQEEHLYGQRRYKIPGPPFLIWLERDIALREEKTIFLKKSHRELKEYLHHG